MVIDEGVTSDTNRRVPRGWRAAGSVLADQPGAGKTLQAIEACKLVGATRVLIVCPAVALAVWRDEIKDCWPELHPSLPAGFSRGSPAT